MRRRSLISLLSPLALVACAPFQSELEKVEIPRSDIDLVLEEVRSVLSEADLDDNGVIAGNEVLWLWNAILTRILLWRPGAEVSS